MIFIHRFGEVWPEISYAVGVMTRVGATSLEVVSTMVLHCPWDWEFGGGGGRLR